MIERRRNSPCTIGSFTNWEIDSKVKARLEGTCFYPFTELCCFRHNTQFIGHVIETYSDEKFQCGECNLYLGLEDIYYITGLPVDGKPIICPDLEYKELVEELLGMDDDTRVPVGFLTHGWLKQNFETVPEEIDVRDNRLDYYVRAYILFTIGTMLLSDNHKGRVFIGYLHFLRDLNVVNNYAWGAAVLAKLHSSLLNNQNSLKGATWILEMFFLERVPRLKNEYLGESCTLNNTFPSFKQWSHLIANYAKKTRNKIPWATILESVRNNDDANGVVWTPYGRFVNEHKMERIFYSRILIFDFNLVIYHRPDHAPQQLGIQNPDSSNLLPLVYLKTKPNKSGFTRNLMSSYKSYIDMWNERRHQSCLKDADPNFVLPDAPVQKTRFQSENSHAAAGENSSRRKSGQENKCNLPPCYVPSEEIVIMEDCEDEEQSAHVDTTADHSKVVPETGEKKSRNASSVIPLTPSMLMKSTEQGADGSPAKCSTHDSRVNPVLSKAKNTSPDKQEVGQENRITGSSKKRERELKAQVTSQNVAVAADQEKEPQSAQVSLKGSSTADDHGENKSPVKKSRKNPLEQSTYPSTRSTNKNRKMSTPEIEETLPNYSNKLRTENSANPSSLGECGATSMPMNSTEKVTDTAITKCSMYDTSGDGMAESSKKRERKQNAQVTGQQVPAAAGDDKRNEDPAEVISEENAETFNQSTSVNGQAESESVGNEDLPFRKTSILWKNIDSLEVFRILPQKPHFSPLLDFNEEIREGAAIGYMSTFASMVEKVSTLQIKDPRSLFDSYSETLALLEEVGFDVKVLVDRINKLLSLKTRQEQLDNESKRYQSSVAKCDEKNAKLEQEITEIYKKKSELEEQLALKKSQKVKEDSSREFLQIKVSSIKDAMSDLEHKFKVKSAAPWQRVI